MRLVFIEQKLELLKSFLDHVSADAGKEWDSIEKKRKAGEYQSFGDYEHARNYPIEHVAIASRAVGYELVALLEHELHQLAQTPWANLSKNKGPKGLLELKEVTPESLSKIKIKLVSDQTFKDVIALIEDHYKFQLSDLDGWDRMRLLRKAVNALKHRNGVKHFNEINWSDKSSTFFQRHETDQKWAYEAIADVRRFLRSLYDATKKK